jgi:hypothetical protein
MSSVDIADADRNAGARFEVKVVKVIPSLLAADQSASDAHRLAEYSLGSWFSSVSSGDVASFCREVCPASGAAKLATLHRPDKCSKTTNRMHALRCQPTSRGTPGAGVGSQCFPRRQR